MNSDVLQLEYVKEIQHPGRGLLIETTWRCLLECPMCRRTRQPLEPKQHKKEYGDLKPIDFRKILNSFKTVGFCGNISDPIYHPKFHEILRIGKEYNANLRIHTNGWGRKESWWRKAFELTDSERSSWIFGLDGLPHQSHNYRVNQKGEEVWEIMKLGSSLGQKIVWQWIPFAYNEDSIVEGVHLATKHNIKFMLRPSSRFTESFKETIGEDFYKLLEPSGEWRVDRKDGIKKIFPDKSTDPNTWKIQDSLEFNIRLKSTPATSENQSKMILQDADWTNKDKWQMLNDDYDTYHRGKLDKNSLDKKHHQGKLDKNS